MRALVLISGIVLSLVALFLIMVGGSLFADFRTENITGPGADVFLLNRYPLEGEAVLLEVSARGGSKAGMNYVMAHNSNDEVVAEEHGEGVTWGETISDKGRGSDDVRISIPQQRVLHHDEIVIALEVNYVCAMSSVSTFTNEEKTDWVGISIPVYTSAGKLKAQSLDLLKAFSFLFAWFLVWYFMLYYVLRNEKDINHLEKDLSSGLLAFVLGGYVIGYWIYARFLGSIFGISNASFTTLAMITWIVMPYFAYKAAQRRLKKQEVS